ncbi:MAG: hypothetical protein LBP33_13225 [Candidatus Adiutrix sp.]|nr:hypothetical protein [Candidatus Adiutrix sp.]
MSKTAAALAKARPALSRPTAVGPGRQKTVARPAAPGPEASAPPRPRKKNWPVLEVVLGLLLIKIAAGGWYILSGPRDLQSPVSPPSSAGAAADGATRALGPLQPEPAPSRPGMDSYLNTAAGAVGPAVAQAAAPALPVTSVSALSAGAALVLGGQAGAIPMARGGSPESIPLPPNADLLTPAAQLPPAPLPALGGGTVPLPPTAGGSDLETLRSLRDREQELARREVALGTREEALAALDNELRQRLAASEASRGEMETMLRRNEAVLAEMKALAEQQKTEEETRKDLRIQHLAAGLKGLKPEQSAPLFDSLDDDIAVVILSAMPPSNAGKILAAMNPEKAARLTRGISEQRIDPNLLLADQPAGGGQMQP